jgi:hypothetical protein
MIKGSDPNEFRGRHHSFVRVLRSARDRCLMFVAGSVEPLM